MNESLLSQYSNQFYSVESTLVGFRHPWLKKLRQDSLERFVAVGFPNTKNEEWKYTSLYTFEKRCYGIETNSEIIPTLKSNYFGLNDSNSYRLTFFNGRFIPALSNLENLPHGLVIKSFAEVLEKEPGLVEQLLLSSQGQEKTFRELNTAFMTGGAYIRIGQAAQIEKPIHLLFIGGGDSKAAHIRNIIIAEAGSSATIVESYSGQDGGEYLTNSISEIVIHDNSLVEHYKLGFESEKAFHFATIQVSQGKDARYISHNIDFGGHLVRNDLHINLASTGAECTLNGLYLAQGNQHIDNNTSVNHYQPHGTSREWYKGILDGNARAAFSGRIVVHPHAQKTDARQTNNNLLLSDNAEIDSKPQLEIYADDVKCGHGTTVGKIDNDALFYLKSRGLNEDLSRRILVNAFAHDILEQMRLPEVKTEIIDQLARRLFQGTLSKELL